MTTTLRAPGIELRVTLRRPRISRAGVAWVVWIANAVLVVAGCAL